MFNHVCFIAGKSSMLSMTAYRALNEWLAPSQPLLFVRFCGTTPNSTSLGPLLKSICQQISYTFMLPFDDIPDDTVPVTAFLKVLSQSHCNLWMYPLGF